MRDSHALQLIVLVKLTHDKHPERSIVNAESPSGDAVCIGPVPASSGAERLVGCRHKPRRAENCLDLLPIRSGDNVPINFKVRLNLPKFEDTDGTDNAENRENDH